MGFGGEEIGIPKPSIATQTDQLDKTKNSF